MGKCIVEFVLPGKSKTPSEITGSLNCGYPKSVLDATIFKATLQGPATKPADSKSTIALVVTQTFRYKT